MTREMLTETGLAVYLLVWPEDGIIRKEDARGIIDGSYFQKKADETAVKRKMKQENKARKGRDQIAGSWTPQTWLKK